jgi:hypothetical protein
MTWIGIRAHDWSAVCRTQSLRCPQGSAMGYYLLCAPFPQPSSATMLSRLRFSTLQCGLVLFWAIWLTLITLTNVTDAMRHLGLLAENISWASYNYSMVAETLGKQGIPSFVAVILFAIVIAWEGLASALLWRAWQVMRRGGDGLSAEVTQAFVVSLALWAAFLIMTEAMVSYETAATHKTTLIAQLATLLVLRSGTSQRA